MKFKPLYLIAFIVLSLFACSVKEEVIESEKVELEQHPFGYYDLYDSKGNLISKEHLFYPDTASLFGRTQGYDYHNHVFEFKGLDFETKHDSLLQQINSYVALYSNKYVYSSEPIENGYQLIISQSDIIDSSVVHSYDTLYLKKEVIDLNLPNTNLFEGYLYISSGRRDFEGYFYIYLEKENIVAKILKEDSTNHYLLSSYSPSSKIFNLLIPKLNGLIQNRYEPLNYTSIACMSGYQDPKLVYNDTIFNIPSDLGFKGDHYYREIEFIVFSDSTKFQMSDSMVNDHYTIREEFYKKMREHKKVSYHYNF